MLLKLADECKQQIWRFLDMQEVCRLACVAQRSEQGVCMESIWHQHSLTLLAKGLESLQTETRMLGCGLRRGFASRNLLAQETSRKVVITRHYNDDQAVKSHAAIDWKRWCQETHVALVRFRNNNTKFNQTMRALQALKMERSQLKEAVQSVKASANANKRARRIQMNCIRWMNRTYRRQAAASNSVQAQNAALSKGELGESLQRVENTIQATTREQFRLRLRATESLHKLNTQLARGTKLLRDLGAHGSFVK